MRPPNLWRRAFRATLIAGLVSAAAPAIAGAATFNVTRFNDPAPAYCAPVQCSLREAVVAANSAGGSNSIVVPAGTYSLNQILQDLPITSNVTITGSGGQAVIDANGSVTGTRAFEVMNGGNLTLQNVSIRNGVGPKDPDNEDRGGAIRVEQGGTLAMTDGEVSDSSVPDTGSQGGGIYTAGKVTLTRVTVDDNSTGFAFGGGIYATNSGYVTTTDSVIASNSSSFGGGFAGTGGAQFNRTLFRDNSAGLGGAAYTYGCGSFKFDESTIANNNSNGSAGAIRDRDADVFLTNTTIAGNTAAQYAGGIMVQQDPNGCPTMVYMANTILAGNVAGTGAPDCLDQTSGDFTSEGHNIVGNPIGCGINPGAGDQFGTPGSPIDPQLGPLAANGGPTDTMALLKGSPAIGAGDTTRCGPNDQRGYAIATDGDKGCDIGAFEVQLPPTNTAPPNVTGRHRLGRVLSCMDGTWSGATPLKFALQWLRNGVPIAGATSNHYRIVKADLHHRLRCSVTATNVAGSATAQSARVQL
jgi:hypothetical protein